MTRCSSPPPSTNNVTSTQGQAAVAVVKNKIAVIMSVPMLVLAASIPLVRCGGSGNGGCPDFRITPANPSIGKGNTQQFTATFF
jgi:hypothetical protein